MTTTSTYKGLQEKPSSRVLAAPGGGSSNIFGHYDEPPESRFSRGNKATSGNADDGAAAPAAGQQNASKQAGSNDVLNQGPAASMPERNKPPRSAFNPITGEPYETKPKTQQPKQEEEEASTEAGQATEQAPQTTSSQHAASAASSGSQDAGVKPSTRVLNPPGGRSTQLW